MKRLPDAEFAIMEYIWDREPPVTTSMVWEALGREKSIKIQTTATLMGRLVESGYLTFQRGKGRERFFYPLIDRDTYLEMETANFLSRYHRGSYSSLLSALHRERLTKEDIGELSRWIEEAGEGAPPARRKR